MTTAPTPPEATSGFHGNIYLVGLMGAGKTSVGRVLAKRLRKVFADSDHEIESRTGVRIPVIFEIEGEAGFRRRESAVIRELAGQHDLVLATGGGVVLDPENRRLLHATGTVVYLRAAPTELWLRTRHDRNRPLLRTSDPLARLEELHRDRDPLYRETAHLIVDTGNQAIRTLVGRLERELHARTPADPDPQGAPLLSHSGQTL
ncbi:MAG: AAA family ATPase [Betaproteobacteria bacterium]|nr:AAA family ATPase [Betaproteobacteria bacterium]